MGPAWQMAQKRPTCQLARLVVLVAVCVQAVGALEEKAGRVAAPANRGLPQRAFVGSVTPLRPTQRCHRAVDVVRPRSPPRVSSAAAAADARGGSPGSPAEHDGAERDWREQQVHQASLSCDEALSLRAVQQMPIPSLDSHGRGRKRALWHSRVSLVLDGLSGIFSLACGTATLACMGIVEWSTMASLAVLVGSLSTAIGGLMVLATAVVSILAVMDTFRTLQSKENDAHLEEEALQALAAPPRRLGSMSGVHKPRGFAKDVW